MTWSTTTLSTGLTIKEIETEIMELAKEQTPYDSVTVNDSALTAYFQDTNDYTSINVGDILLITNSLSVVTPVYVLSKDGDNTVTVGTGLSGLYGAASSFSYQSWQPKINFAKTKLQTALENYLSSNGYKVDEDSGENLIDLIANPDIFARASDYMTLFLIFSDLELGGTVNEIFDRKKDFYLECYREEMEAKLKQVNIDIDLDGDADRYRVTIAKISRLTR